MTDLSPEAKELLDLSRDDDSPTPGDRARVRRALAATLALGITSTSAAAATKSTLGAAGAAAKSTVATWLVVGVVAGLAGSAAIFVGVPALKSSSTVEHGRTPVQSGTAVVAAHGVATSPLPDNPNAPSQPGNVATAPEIASPAVATAPEITSPSVATAPVPTTQLAVSGTPSKNSGSPRLSVSRTTGSAPGAQRTTTETTAAAAGVATAGVAGAGVPAAPGAVATPAPAATTPPAAATPTSSLGAETSLLESARAALTRGDAVGALTLLDQHDREFPRGVLVEEQLATRVFALCSIGRRADATRVAGQLLRLSPASPLRSRVLASCAYGGAPAN